jgi:hypothetical protein
MSHAPWCCWELLGSYTGDEARRTAEGLSWESELDRLDASYREVVAGPPASLQPIGKDARDRRTAAPLALGVHPTPVRLDQMLHDGEA